MDLIKKILIIRNDHIGDFALSTQVFRELRKKYPKSRITLITSKINIPLAEKITSIDKIIVLEKPGYNLSLLLEYLKISLLLRKEKFDIGIDLRGSLIISIFLLWLAGVKKRIGKYDNSPSIIKNFLNSLFLNKPVKTDFYKSNRHITQDNIYIINKGLGISLKNNFPEISIDTQDIKDVDGFMDKNNLKRFLCICPISDIQKKQWSIDKFKELIKWLDKKEFKILLLGTKKHRELLDNLSKFSKKSIVVLDFNLRKLSILFKRSELVIAQDGGPFHIAWISGAKTVEIVGRWPQDVARGKMAALKNCREVWSKGENLDEITLEEVKKAVCDSL